MHNSDVENPNTRVVRLLRLEPLRRPSIFIVNSLAIIFACAISECTDGEILAEVASEIHESDRQRLCELAGDCRPPGNWLGYWSQARFPVKILRNFLQADLN